MRQENISRALGAIDGRFIEEASAYSFSVGAGIIEKESASQMNNGRCGKKIDGRMLLRICLAAAVSAALLTVTAYAAVSIHTRRRQEIRQNMNIDASNTESYVEYAADDGGVTLLSAINDGEFQRVYVNISPVDMAEIKAWPDEGSFLWSVSEDCGGYANPVLQPGRSLSGRDEITEAVLQDAYDAETKTLTVQCYIPNDALAQLVSGTVELTLMRFNIDAYDASGYASRRDWAQDTGNVYGTVSFAPTEHEVRYISFGGVVRGLRRCRGTDGRKMPSGKAAVLHRHRRQDMCGRRFASYRRRGIHDRRVYVRRVRKRRSQTVLRVGRRGDRYKCG